MSLDIEEDWHLQNLPQMKKAPERKFAGLFLIGNYMPGLGASSFTLNCDKMGCLFIAHQSPRCSFPR